MELGTREADTYTDTLGLVKGGDWRNQIIGFDVTTDVADALAEGQEEVGWMLERSNPGRGRVKLGSREWVEKCMFDPDFGPRLIVEVE